LLCRSFSFILIKKEWMEQTEGSAMKIFLFLTLLLSTMSADEIVFHFADPAKAERVKLNFEKPEDEVSRYYAHKGVYIVKDDEILFNNFSFSLSGFKQSFDNESGILSTQFVQIKKDDFNDYVAIFILFKDSTFRYYVFKRNTTRVLINTVKLPEFDIPDSAEIKVTYPDPETGRYGIKITSSEFEEDKNFVAIIVLEESKKDE
jgi:hypothetical protein